MQQLLSGQVAIPLDVDDTTVIVLEEIARLGMTIESFAGEKLVIIPRSSAIIGGKCKRRPPPWPTNSILDTTECPLTQIRSHDSSQIS